MARAMRPLILLFMTLWVFLTMAAATTDTGFIKSSCSTTRYPTLCVQSLSSYASVIKQSPRQMALMALTVTLVRTQTTRNFVVKSSKFKGLKPLEYNVITDCVVQIKDSEERLTPSVEEMKKAEQSEGQDLSWRMNNIQTWVSAAMTNANTCYDAYSSKALDGKLKDSIRARALRLVQANTPQTSKHPNIETCRLGFRNLNFSDNVSPVASRNLSLLISNTLAVNEALMSHGKQGSYDGDFPNWVSNHDRKLLQSGSRTTMQANLVVAKDGSGNFNSIQKALNEAAKRTSMNSRFIIYVKSGVYREIIEVAYNNNNIMLIGEGIKNTIITRA